MKKLFFPLLLFLLFACEDKSFDPANPSVETFVEMLIDGAYKVSPTEPLPQFRSYDIPLLLVHSRNFREIPTFPTKSVSSYLPGTYRLGECLLWTIEAIRLSPPDAEQLAFPSLAPALILEEAPENNEGRLSEEELLKVYRLYEDWWAKKEDNTFQELQAIDPLAGSGYRWR